MSYTYTEQVTLERRTCATCGITYAVPEQWIEERRDVGGDFYCPNGHCRVFVEPEIPKLRRELDEKSKALTVAKCEALWQRQLKDKAERKLHRVGKGVCPCCKRSFVNLQRHMKTKHPEATK